MKTTAFALLALAICGLTACSIPATSPKERQARVRIQKSFSDPLIARAHNAKPTIQFPARIGVAPMNDDAKLQLRNLDALGKLDGLKKLPNLAAFVNISSLLMSSGYDGDESKHKPIWNKGDLIIREAAAKLHTHAVLLVKLETIVTDGQIFAPLSMLTLGMFPNDRAEVMVTALAALVDTRTGYVYGVLERSAGRTNYSISWDDDSRDRAVRKTEQAAAQKLIGEFPDFWLGVVQAHRK
jgi:hypothetical protein